MILSRFSGAFASRCSKQHTFSRRWLAQVQILQTTLPTVFTTSEMDPEVDLGRYGSATKELFTASPNYLHPADLNYNFPTDGSPEFAFVGRSNVGKSSLIDLLLGSQKLVKVSKEPGCTRSINYYGLSKVTKSKNYMAYFVDLPGYGFAKKSKDEQKKWTEIIHSYVSTRDQTILRRVFVLVDIRRGVKQGDLDIMTTLNDAFIPYQIVLTKSDLVAQPELLLTVKQIFEVINLHGTACMPFVHVLSSATGSGIDSFKLSIGEVFDATRRH